MEFKVAIEGMLDRRLVVACGHGAPRNRIEGECPDLDRHGNIPALAGTA
jgi:hypothetical protein